VPYCTAAAGRGTDTVAMHRTQGKQMANARIDRMVRELNSEPSSQFFQHLFGLVGLGKDSLAQPAARQSGIPASLLKTAPAR
jgi:hypothetical protein